MRAFQVSDFDTPPELRTIATPAPAQGEVLVKIEACGLNFADLLMCKGTYQSTPAPPFTLGMEIAGTVAAQGPGVTHPAIGSRIAVFGGQGGLAEFGTFPADRCRNIPDAMPDTIAAGLMVAYGTSHLALTQRARLRKGETLLVLGAAGGVGLAAVEIGHTIGARVIAVARGAAKLEQARAAGADVLIDSDNTDLRSTLKALGGVDVVYDPVGGEAFAAAMSGTKPLGRILVIGFASGAVPAAKLNVALVKNIDIIGVNWGGYLGFASNLLDDSLAEVMRWYADGRLHPHVSHQVPLEQAAEALDLLASRRSTGKVVVTI